jgi:hypothetical protein
VNELDILGGAHAIELRGKLLHLSAYELRSQ